MREQELALHARLAQQEGALQGQQREAELALHDLLQGREAECAGLRAELEKERKLVNFRRQALENGNTEEYERFFEATAGFRTGLRVPGGVRGRRDERAGGAGGARAPAVVVTSPASGRRRTRYETGSAHARDSPFTSMKLLGGGLAAEGCGESHHVQVGLLWNDEVGFFRAASPKTGIVLGP